MSQRSRSIGTEEPHHLRRRATGGTVPTGLQDRGDVQVAAHGRVGRKPRRWTQRSRHQDGGLRRDRHSRRERNARLPRHRRRRRAVPRCIGAVGHAQQLHHRLRAAQARIGQRPALDYAHRARGRAAGELRLRHHRDLPPLRTPGAGRGLWQQTAQSHRHRGQAQPPRRRPQSLPRNLRRASSKPPPNRR